MLLFSFLMFKSFKEGCLSACAGFQGVFRLKISIKIYYSKENSNLNRTCLVCKFFDQY